MNRPTYPPQPDDNAAHQGPPDNDSYVAYAGTYVYDGTTYTLVVRIPAGKTGPPRSRSVSQAQVDRRILAWLKMCREGGPHESVSEKKDA
jgi:hypothetical protein